MQGLWKIIALVSLGVLSSSPISAQGTRNSVLGLGTAPCEYYNSSSASSQDQAIQWVFGYLSAGSLYENRLGSPFTRKFREIEAQSIINALEYYCAGNPLRTVGDAAYDILRQLDASVQ